MKKLTWYLAIITLANTVTACTTAHTRANDLAQEVTLHSVALDQALIAYDQSLATKRTEREKTVTNLLDRREANERYVKDRLLVWSVAGKKASIKMVKDIQNARSEIQSAELLLSFDPKKPAKKQPVERLYDPKPIGQMVSKITKLTGPQSSSDFLNEAMVFMRDVRSELSTENEEDNGEDTISDDEAAEELNAKRTQLKPNAPNDGAL